MEDRALVSVCLPALAPDWRLVANMQRVYRASLTGRLGRRFLLVEKGGQCSIASRCERLQATPPLRYLVYRCRPESSTARTGPGLCKRLIRWHGVARELGHQSSWTSRGNRTEVSGVKLWSLK